jgi:hypothetical protein
MGAGRRIVSAIDEAEYLEGKRKLDHMAKHHGMKFELCRACSGDDPLCPACGGDGEVAHANWKNCGRFDCPVRAGRPS